MSGDNMGRVNCGELEEEIDEDEVEESGELVFNWLDEAINWGMWWLVVSRSVAAVAVAAAMAATAGK